MQFAELAPTRVLALCGNIDVRDAESARHIGIAHAFEAPQNEDRSRPLRQFQQCNGSTIQGLLPRKTFIVFVHGVQLIGLPTR